jgi:hypothetical protein
VLDLRRAGELGLEVGDLVTCADGQLRGPGGQLVDLGSTREWSAELPTLPFPGSSAAWLRRHLVAEGVRGGALSRPTGPGAAPTMESAVADRLTVHLDGLLDALRAAAPEAVRHHASSLVGLGTGLTPAGDDALLGVILVAVMPGSMLAAARAPLAAVVRDAAARTTDVSHAALAQAVRGRTRESLMTLLHQLAEAADEQTLARLGRRVTAIGHTSGTDILTGLSAALDLDHQLRGEK